MQKWIGILGMLVLAACGSENPNGEGSESLAERNAAVAATFVDHWCAREHRLPQETALTVALLVNAAGVSDCKDAAPILAAKVELQVGVPYSGHVTDLRPLATLTGLKSLSLNHMELDSVLALMPLQALKELEVLDLGSNQIKNVRGLSHFTKRLKRLSLSQNPLVDAPEAPVFSESEVAGWPALELLELTQCNLGKAPLNLPQSVSVLDFRKNAFTAEAFANLAPVADQPPRFPNLKTILLQEAFPETVPAAEIPALIQAAQSGMPEVHFKTF